MITTISGIVPILGCIIVSKIGDISRFESPSKLVAYAGLDASVRQSERLIPLKIRYPNAVLLTYDVRIRWRFYVLTLQPRFIWLLL